MSIEILDNSDEIFAAVKAVVDSYDFTTPGEGGQTLGRNLATTAADGIAQRSAEGLDPERKAWRANELHYALYKAERYSVHRPGELGGQMLSRTSLLGRTTLAPDAVEMRYGTGEPPRAKSARSGVAMRPGELKATDVEKGGYFTEGGRDFYLLDDPIIDELFETASDALAAHIEEAF